eukprot:CAMPEP_0182928038 /NCGR_PEP_ID=MMETSP0105_2-20130417/14996_1 /TAXON_ID=81532 ORGANISM="Acanthoeca-like sp., Strain 10tr" /NCGR_SAMPLE_ID=MMETSP0105_2 /ASSEMBLY_ACC=CAM_ASM_000205 /LENGTH=241 /DNA_ID=CAMNT_0025066025 /DNA_START=15 /DNA_END=740 /DNA_ORIENTATION=+
MATRVGPKGMGPDGREAWYGEWSAVAWEGNAYVGGDPDPSHDERRLQIGPDGCTFLRRRRFLCFRWTSTQKVADGTEIEAKRTFTVPAGDGEQLVFTLVDDSNLEVQFVYGGDKGGVVTYRHNRAVAGTGKAQPLEWWTGRWCATQWTGGAREGGDPDPINDEATLTVSPSGTLAIGDSCLGATLSSSTAAVVFQTPDKELVVVTPRGPDAIEVWFKDYPTPGTIVYTRDPTAGKPSLVAA